MFYLIPSNRAPARDSGAAGEVGSGKARTHPRPIRRLAVCELAVAVVLLAALGQLITGGSGCSGLVKALQDSAPGGLRHPQKLRNNWRHNRA